MPEHVEGGADAQALPHPAIAGAEGRGIDGLSFVFGEDVAFIFYALEHKPPFKLQFVQFLHFAAEVRGQVQAAVAAFGFGLGANQGTLAAFFFVLPANKGAVKLSESSFKRARKVLEENGYLIVEAQGGRRQSHYYLLSCVSPGKVLQPAKILKDDRDAIGNKD